MKKGNCHRASFSQLHSGILTARHRDKKNPKQQFLSKAQPRKIISYENYRRNRLQGGLHSYRLSFFSEAVILLRIVFFKYYRNKI